MLIVLLLGFLFGWFLRTVYNQESKCDDKDETTFEQIVEYMYETYIGKEHTNEHCVLYRFTENGSREELLLRIAEEYEELKEDSKQ